MLKLLRRAVYGLLPVYAYLVVLAAKKVPMFRMLDADMREGMIRNYQYYQTDHHILESSERIQKARHVETSSGTEPQYENQMLVDDNEKVLALLTPPGIIGGYRNQVIRFLSLVRYAQIQNIRKLLLPSLLWSTTHRAAKDEMRFFPVPMHQLFDVDYWNLFNESLPLLVDSVSGESDCWKSLQDATVLTAIEQRILEEKSKPKTKKDRKKPYILSPMTKDVLQTSGYLTPIANETFDYLAGKRPNKPRKNNLLPAVEHCQNPQVLGGGKGAGILWNMWDRMQKLNKSNPAVEKLIATAQQALRPNQRWRQVADQCVLHNLLNERLSSAKDDQTVPRYLALHARVEVDMMVHQCGKDTEKNLTNIFDMVDSFSKDYNYEHSLDQQLRGIFVAVSRNNMQQTWKGLEVTTMAEHNWMALNERSPIPNVSTDRGEESQQTQNGKLRVFECGEIWMDQWYRNQDDIPDDYYGSILPSLLNFYIATQAEVFIGVDKSSWSADVWAARFHLGKGYSNYKYTANRRIVRLANGGRPPTHLSCKKMNETESLEQETTEY